MISPPPNSDQTTSVCANFCQEDKAIFAQKISTASEKTALKHDQTACCQRSETATEGYSLSAKFVLLSFPSVLPPWGPNPCPLNPAKESGGVLQVHPWLQPQAEPGNQIDFLLCPSQESYSPMVKLVTGH